MISDRGGQTQTSRQLVTRYGFSIAAGRLQGRGLIDEHNRTWRIVDPFFAEWLRPSSPLADVSAG